VSELGRFLGDGWRALTTGELPRDKPLTGARPIECATCGGSGEVQIGDVFVACQNPKHKPADED
jgi:hypothetical protein